MRYRAILGIAVAVCVCAIAVAPALAGPVFKATEVGTEFTETEPGKGKTKNLPEQVQHFIFGPFHIQCPKAIGHGKVSAEQSKTFYQEVEFKECFVRAILFGSEQEIKLAAHFKSPVDIEWHANRWAEVGSESESELRLLNGQTITMGVPSIKCKIIWPAQVVPIKAEKNPEGKFSMVKYENIEAEKLGPGGKKTGEVPLRLPETGHHRKRTERDAVRAGRRPVQRIQQNRRRKRQIHRAPESMDLPGRPRSR